MGQYAWNGVCDMYRSVSHLPMPCRRTPGQRMVCYWPCIEVYSCSCVVVLYAFNWVTQRFYPILILTTATVFTHFRSKWSKAWCLIGVTQGHCHTDRRSVCMCRQNVYMYKIDPALYEWGHAREPEYASQYHIDYCPVCVCRQGNGRYHVDESYPW